MIHPLHWLWRLFSFLQHKELSPTYFTSNFPSPHPQMHHFWEEPQMHIYCCCLSIDSVPSLHNIISFEVLPWIPAMINLRMQAYDNAINLESSQESKRCHRRRRRAKLNFGSWLPMSIEDNTPGWQTRGTCLSCPSGPSRSAAQPAALEWCLTRPENMKTKQK